MISGIFFLLDGENGKMKTSATVIVLSVVVPSFAVTIISVLAFVLYRRKKRAGKHLQIVVPFAITCTKLTTLQ